MNDSCGSVYWYRSAGTFILDYTLSLVQFSLTDVEESWTNCNDIT